MIIQHNLSSMNTNRNLGVVNRRLAKSTEKLSSGYRINRAGDDAAGLAISEKMRGQIRGLDRAVNNSEDGISMIQTAEGAMQESQNILQRMRELSVQSANDINTNDDRQHIQEEIDQLTMELDRIANTTEFNTKKLTNGDYSASSGDKDLKTQIQEYLKGTWLQDSLTRIKDATGMEITSKINLTVQFQTGLGSTVAQMGATAGGSDFTLTINEDFLTGKSINDFKGNSGLEAGGILFDRLITHEMTHSVMMHNCSSSVLSDLNSGAMWFVEGLAEAVQGNDRFSADTTDAVVDNMNAAGSEAIYKQGYLAVSWMANNISTGTFSDFMNSLDTDGASFDSLVNYYYGDATSADLFNRIKGLCLSDTNSFLDQAHITLGDGLDDALGDWDADAKAMIANGGAAEEIANKSENVTLDDDVWNIKWEGIDTSKDGLRVQLGANAGQEVLISVGDLRTQNLFGFDKLDVTTHDKASSSITRVDNAIQKVSGFRAKLGAMQNRLESAVSSLSVSSENLTSSESRIRDTDMADEMTAYTKNNILQQAAQSMLSQANSQNQGVLSLLS